MKPAATHDSRDDLCKSIHAITAYLLNCDWADCYRCTLDEILGQIQKYPEVPFSMSICATHSIIMKMLEKIVFSTDTWQVPSAHPPEAPCQV